MRENINKDDVIIERNEYVIGKRVAQVSSVFKKTEKRTIFDAFVAIIKREKDK